MFEYKIRLNFNVKNCFHCPFRQEQIQHEGVESMDKLSGVVQIIKRESRCALKDGAVIRTSEEVNGYNSTCPLKNCMTEINE